MEAQRGGRGLKAGGASCCGRCVVYRQEVLLRFALCPGVWERRAWGLEAGAALSPLPLPTSSFLTPIHSQDAAPVTLPSRHPPLQTPLFAHLAALQPHQLALLPCSDSDGPSRREEDEGHEVRQDWVRMSVEARVQFLSDRDPFDSLGGYLEPVRPLPFTFSLHLPVGDQIPAIIKLLKPPHKVKDPPIGFQTRKGFQGGV